MNGKDELKNDYLAQYFERMNNQEFGEMYNSANAKLFADQPNNIIKPLLSEREIITAPPTIYDLLAWAYPKERSEKVASSSKNT
jgi:hypothetical protein